MLMESLLEICGRNPITGFYRDGYCRTGPNDYGSHTVCAIVTEEFLSYTKQQGNDLSTPRGTFSGLKDGDYWCLCASRWKQAEEYGVAPNIILESSHISALQKIDYSILSKYQFTNNT